MNDLEQQLLSFYPDLIKEGGHDFTAFDVSYLKIVGTKLGQAIEFGKLNVLCEILQN
jgi:hypothetical protein